MYVAYVSLYFRIFFFLDSILIIESVCCFNRGLVLFCDMLCYVHSYTDPLAHIYSRFLTGIIMKNEHRSNFPAGFVTQIRGI